LGKDENGIFPTDAGEWFRDRSYHHEQFSDLSELGRLKRDSGRTVSLVLPGRDVADTIGGVLDGVHTVNELCERVSGVPLADEVLVIDADSEDGTARIASNHGAEVYSENDLMSRYGGTHGKGDAMWRSLSVATGDTVMFADTDTRDFKPEFVSGTLGPLLTVPEIRYVKAAYRRPFKSGESVEPDGGGRVTELSAKPLFNLFYPELTGFVQPLAGEFAADRELLLSIPFLTGYAVETGIMIDVLDKAGLGAMAQVDLGERQNRHQSLRDLSRMSYAVLRAVARRLREDGRLHQIRDASLPETLFQFSDYRHAVATPDGLELQEYVEELVERPPMAEVQRVG
jgi:glucosyl-3-phosphoglycerate synthase